MTDRPPGPDDEGGFLSRWSRRKALVREGQPLPAEPPAPAPVVALRPGPAAALPVATPTPAAALEPAPPPPAAPAAPTLTLADVEKLTADSDYSAFTSRAVDADVRNAAMKKLFHSDPHFQVMDGLDVYIDDYNTPDPLPRAIMRTMQQARSLGLLDDELTDQDKPEPDEVQGACPAADTQRPDEDADLQLQPDYAAGPEGAGQCPGAGIDDGPAATPRPDDAG